MATGRRHPAKKHHGALMPKMMKPLKIKMHKASHTGAKMLDKIHTPHKW